SGSQGEPASNSNDYGLMLLLQKIDELEDEVQMLHGQLEELHHEVEANRKAERTRYVDVDARLKALAERNEAEATAEALEAETDVREQDREAYIAAREELLAKITMAPWPASRNTLKIIQKGSFVLLRIFG